MSDTQLRVRFITSYDAFRLPDTPFALPAKLSRNGLSDVVNHLLDLSSKPQPFDFLCSGKLVRQPLYKLVEALGIDTENIVILEYFPATSLREPDQSLEVPSWVGAIDVTGTSGLYGIAGCYDGQLKIFTAENEKLEVKNEIVAHEDAIRTVCSLRQDMIASGGRDQIVKLWSVEDGNLTNKAILKGHVNSVECMTTWTTPTGDNLLLSGDWSGNLVAWKWEQLLDSTTSVDEAPGKKKKRTDTSSEVTVREGTPLFTLKAHAQSLSGVVTCANSVTAYTSSWDHSVKVWDLDRQDCVRSLNSGHVVTGVSAALNSEGGDVNIVATSHTDGVVRIWDTRASADNATAATHALGGVKSRLGPVWASGVAWQPGSSTLLSSIDYNGALHLWDLRSSVPVGSVEAHDGKALALGWKKEQGANGDSWRVITGGSDCSIKSSALEF